MKLYQTFYSYRVGNKTVTRSCRIPANSSRTAERMIRAWLALRGITPFSGTAET